VGTSEQSPQGIKTDPYYKMALGRFYERVMNEYPNTRPWQPPSFPRRWSTTQPSICFEWGGDDGRRFRWVGILSIHERDEYEWNDFARRSEDALRKL
jgi:hypothetical protein